MRDVIITTDAMARFNAATDEILESGKAMSGFILAYGQAGRGKSVAADQYHIDRGGAYVRVWQGWSQTAFLQRLLFEVRGKNMDMPRHTCGSCETAIMLSQDYDGRVQVVNNQRISVTQRQSVLDAKELAEKGYSAEAIKEILEREKMESSIYIMVDTLYYLKKGGRITPAAAALGTLLKLKPVLQIQGEKLDSFAKARTVKQAKKMMIDAMRNDFDHRFNDPEGKNIYLEMAYTHNLEDAEAFKKEVEAEFPGMEIVLNPLSLSVSCHIGPGALAVACSKKIPELLE